MKKRMGLFAAVLIAAAAGVGSASALISTDGQDAVGGPDTMQPDGRGAVIAATTGDPVSGRTWAVRVYHTNEGQTCAEVARAEGDEFGQYDDAGKLQPLQVQGGGGCSDFAKSPVSVGVTRFPAREGHDARSVLSGVVASGVQRLVLHTIVGERDVSIQNGAYVVVLGESELGVGAALDATMHDGTTLNTPLGSSHLPDHELPSSEG
jgi:hypothetical protein